MIQGDYYPHLRHMQIEPSKVIVQQRYLPPRSWADSQARYMIEQQAVPGVKITMPEQDWEGIMEIYKNHFHAENSNPGVRDAWEKYRIMVTLTR
jgi:hypothetical protein